MAPLTIVPSAPQTLPVTHFTDRFLIDLIAERRRTAYELADAIMAIADTDVAEGNRLLDRLQSVVQDIELATELLHAGAVA